MGTLVLLRNKLKELGGGLRLSILTFQKAALMMHFENAYAVVSVGTHVRTFEELIVSQTVPFL